MVRAQVDHLVDRPQVQARRRAQPSGTNSPSSSHPRLKHRARCVIFFRARHAAARVAPERGPGRLHREAAGERPPRARPQRRGSPDPIPNSAVKPAFAESTAAPGCGRTGRRAHAGRFRMDEGLFGPFFLLGAVRPLSSFLGKNRVSSVSCFVELDTIFP